MTSRRASWVSLSPFGLRETKPRHFREMARVAWENRRRLPYAWRILTRGVCDGCALGTSGLSDWTIEGTHLCMVRLELMRLNTIEPMDPRRLADTRSLARLSSSELRSLGRLPQPMVRKREEAGFRAISWDEAVDLAADRLRSADPDRVAFYLTSRGIPNETYYVAQKAARFLGTNHVDNAARLCHAASTAAMKATLGHGAATGNYRDWLESDLIVLFGSNAANNQPVTTKYLHQAKKNGTRLAVVNPYREPGLERYWVPSVPESALFGTRLADEWFDVHTGGDLAFLAGVFKALLEDPEGVDREFVRARTVGFERAALSVRALSWDRVERESGCPELRIRAFARLLVERPRANFVWSMGLTQHAHGVETVRAVVNVALARGLPARPASGLMPIRGHSGVQGGAEVGCVPNVDDATRERWESVWGFSPPRGRGMAVRDQIEAAAAGRIDVFWMVGGNFLETLPDPERSRAALGRPALRIHQDVVLSSAMLVEPADLVLLLPATTRYEVPGGVTETSTERRIIFSPEIPGPRVAGARPEWQVFSDVLSRVRPGEAEKIRFPDVAAVRREIARAVPAYAGIETLSRAGDQVQWGGDRLFADGRFATPDGKARFSEVSLDKAARTDHGSFRVSTRRGKQFNSMVQRETDPLTGADRDSVLVSAEDARSLGLREGDAIRLVSRTGEFRGRARVAPMAPGNFEVHWPEGNVLLSADVFDPESGEPDFNAWVKVEKEPRV